MAKARKRSNKNTSKSWLFKKINKGNNQKKFDYFQCSHCKNIITFANPQSKNIFIDCPICVKEGIVGYSKTKKPFLLVEQLSKDNKTYKTKYILYKPLIKIKYSGLIFLMLGMFFLVYPTILNIKFSSSLIIIGCVILALIPGRKYFYIKSNDTQIRKYSTLITKIKTNESIIEKIKNLKNKIDVSEKLAILMIILIVFSFLITGANNFEIYLIIIYLGILIIRELSVEFIPKHIKTRVNVFIIVFLVIFLAIIIKRVINVISI